MSLRTFEGTSLEAVLEEARAAAGPGVRIVEANKLRKGGIGGFFAKERFEVTVDLDAAEAPAPAAAPKADPLLALADRVEDADPASTLSTEQEAFAELLGRIREDATPTAAAPAPRPAPVAVPELAMPAPSGHLGLARLGLPAAIVPAGDDAETSLLHALRMLPAARPVPRSAGEVVAVVGERDQALALARTIAAELGLGEDDVVLAAEGDHGQDLPVGGLLPSLPAVSEERCSARWRARPSVVAVAAPVRPTTSNFARRALEALEPSATWGAVAASAKPEDVIAWSDSVGGLDAVAVEGLDDTSTPASILGTGIPVARLDGRPASPALWTALLLERLAA